jgi:hypothetical protein
VGSKQTSKSLAKIGEYVGHRAAGLTQRQAYLRAFPHSQKWKPATVDNRAYEFEKRSEVQARLKEARRRAEEEAIEEGILDGKWVLKRLMEIAGAKTTDFVTIEDGRVEVKDTTEVPEYKLAAIASIREHTGAFGDTIEIKLHNPTKILLRLGEAAGVIDPAKPSGAGSDIEDLTTLAELLSDDDTDGDN